MDWLEKGYEERFNPGVLLRPGFDPIRSDPRFQDVNSPDSEFQRISPQKRACSD
jgi:hypothetical protein